MNTVLGTSSVKLQTGATATAGTPLGPDPNLLAIDITTAGQLLTIRALRDRAEARWATAGGPTFPLAGTQSGGGRHAASGVTVHHLEAIPHPTGGGRFALVTNETHLGTHIAAEIAACKAAVAANTATNVQTLIANLPSPAALDATWDNTNTSG